MKDVRFITVFALALLLTAFSLSVACSGKTSNQHASPTVVPHTPTPSSAGSPLPPQPLPREVLERFGRPLTDAEIMRLPPETRDMILKAQGKPIPSPSPSPKKNKK